MMRRSQSRRLAAKSLIQRSAAREFATGPAEIAQAGRRRIAGKRRQAAPAGTQAARVALNPLLRQFPYTMRCRRREDFGFALSSGTRWAIIATIASCGCAAEADTLRSRREKRGGGNDVEERHC